MKPIPFFLHVLFVFCLGLPLFGQNDSIPPSQTQIIEAQVNVNLLESRINSLQDSIEAIQLLTKKYEERLAKTEALAAIFDKPLPSLFELCSYSILAVLILLYAFWKILNLTNPKWYVTLIQKLVERYEETNVLKRNKKVLVISPPESKNVDFINSFFSEKQFNVKKATANQYLPPQDSFDIVFMNHEFGGMEQEEMEKYLENHERTNLFYFGRPGGWAFGSKPHLNKRVNYANSRSQIYGNLISTMKHHDLTVPKISS